MKRLRVALATTRARIRLWWLNRTVLDPATDLHRALHRYARAQGITPAEALQHLARMNPIRGRARHLPASRRERRARRTA